MGLAIVTGASSGIGREVAKILAAQGFEIVAVARRKEELEKLTQELHPAKVSIRVIDLGKPASAFHVFAGIDKVDVLINCAGVAKFGSVDRTNLSDDENTVNVNCLSLVELCRLAATKMSSGSTIINVSSLASEIPVPHMAVYSASKAFVTNFTLALAEELRPRGISVVSVNPGGVNTPFIVSAGMDASVNEKSSGLLVSPAYVARAIVRAIRYPRSIVVPVRSGPLLPFLLWLCPRPLKARLAGKQYQTFYRK